MRLVPWADALWACDRAWWQENKGAPDFGGLKLTHDGSCLDRGWGIRAVKIRMHDDRLLLQRYGVIGWGGNGGFHALNLAVQFGAPRIVLVGYDMRLDRGMHWHGAHTGGLSNPTDSSVARWRAHIDGAAETLSAVGVRVINVSPISALKNYQKMDFEEAINVAADA